MLEHPGGQEIPVNRLGRGQYFGEIALLRGGTRVATVRAGSSGDVEVMALDRETFQRLIGESELARQDFDRVIAERLRSLA